MVAEIFEDAERRMHKAVDALRQDLAAIRTGRASSALIERIQIDYYGTLTPINQVATISVPDARQLLIQTWDRKLLTDIESYSKIRPGYQSKQRWTGYSPQYPSLK